jgi:hypothetical protein
VRKSVLLLALLSVGPVAIQAQQPELRSVQSKIATLERSWKIQAYETKDLRMLDVLLDPSFVAVDEQGRIWTKPEFLARVQAIEPSHWALEALDVRIHGDTAIVTAQYTYREVKEGRVVLRRGRFVDTWIEKDGRWWALASLSVSAD